MNAEELGEERDFREYFFERDITRGNASKVNRCGLVVAYAYSA
jgi:hypothetical protein